MVLSALGTVYHKYSSLMDTTTFIEATSAFASHILFRAPSKPSSSLRILIISFIHTILYTLFNLCYVVILMLNIRMWLFPDARSAHRRKQLSHKIYASARGAVSPHNLSPALSSSAYSSFLHPLLPIITSHFHAFFLTNSSKDHSSFSSHLSFRRHTYVCVSMG
jgi:hypothetical protein